jgi:hypothetical protein
MNLIKSIHHASFILLTSICVNNDIKCQEDYIKIIEPHKTWNVIYYVCGCVPCSWWTNALTIGKDTLINGKTYFEVLTSWRISNDFRSSGYYIREDTDKKCCHITFRKRPEKVFHVCLFQDRTIR